MTKEIWTFRPEPWLVTDLNTYANKHTIANRTEALHRYVQSLKDELALQKNYPPQDAQIQRDKELPQIPSTSRSEPDLVFCADLNQDVARITCEKCQAAKYIYTCPKIAGQKKV